MNREEYFKIDKIITELEYKLKEKYLYTNDDFDKIIFGFKSDLPEENVCSMIRLDIREHIHICFVNDKYLIGHDSVEFNKDEPTLYFTLEGFSFGWCEIKKEYIIDDIITIYDNIFQIFGHNKPKEYAGNDFTMVFRG